MTTVKMLNNFTLFCKKHPDMSFWEALSRWSKLNIYASKKIIGNGLFTNVDNLWDTFYWENKNEIRY